MANADSTAPLQQTIEAIQDQLDILAAIHGALPTLIVTMPDGALIKRTGRRGGHSLDICSQFSSIATPTLH